MFDELHMTGCTADECHPLIMAYHYSKRMPAAVHHCYAWRKQGGLFGDSGEPQAVVMYSQPVARFAPDNMLELIRLVRRDDFKKPLSEFIAWSLRHLKNTTKYDAVLSYADTTENHHGGIYQACNFVYVHQVESGHIGFEAEDGSFWHRRTCNAKFGTSGVSGVQAKKSAWKPIYGEPKHLYIYPLNKRKNKILAENEWKESQYPKPNAACLSDASVPTAGSQVQTLEAAPI